MHTRLLLSLSALLIGLGACASPQEAGAPASADPAPAEALAVRLVDFAIEPAELEVSGPTIAFEVTNDGPTPHNLTVRNAGDEVLIATEDLSVGEVDTVSTELEPGSYTIFCSLPGHESLGMSGTLEVTGR